MHVSSECQSSTQDHHLNVGASPCPLNRHRVVGLGPVDVIVASPRPGWGVEALALPWRRCTGGNGKTGKLWTASTFTRDHVRFMAELPHYLSAYVVPGQALDPVVIESVMVTVNTISTCPYCTGLHGQLSFRMAKTGSPTRAHQCVYATAFAQEAGRGAKVRDAFDKLASSIGYGKALSVRALCWALLWGKTTGNSINSVRGKLLELRWLKMRPSIC